MRQRIADTAAQLFAEHGYENVAMSDVAKAVDVSDQTIYNYFPSKHDLVLDRAEAIRLRFGQTVALRPSGTSPAAAMADLAREDIDRYRQSTRAQSLGEYTVLSVTSPAVRRHALEGRYEQTTTVAAAIAATNPELPAAIVHAHAAALVGLFQYMTDRMGQAFVDDVETRALAEELQFSIGAALDDLDQNFHRLLTHHHDLNQASANPPTPR